MLALLSFTLLSLQQGDVIAQRLAGRVSPNVAAVVEQLGDSAARRGLPVDPLIQKAIEGAAKAVPDDRITVAVRVVAMQLDTAALALRDGGALGTDTLAVAAGAFAMTAGLSAADITALARVGANPHDLTIGLRVAGTLAAMGVPQAEDIGLVSVTLRSGKAAADLLQLPANVQSAVARGMTPAAAASGLSRAAAAQARHGPPPGHGQPRPHTHP